ncbi:MAG: hypothetical protein ACRDJN_14965 [Chloroflexota bacterium]
MATHDAAQTYAPPAAPVRLPGGDGAPHDARATRRHGQTRRIGLSAPWRNLLLTAHLIVSVGLLGADAVLIALGIAGLSGADPATVYPAGHLVARVVVRPLAVLALTTGLALGLLTPWGLVRHWWVTIKLALTLVLSGLALFVLTPRLGALADAATAGAGAALPFAARLPLVLAVTAAGSVLVLNVVLAVYKPFGRLARRSSN